jgi:hypothetical protein
MKSLDQTIHELLNQAPITTATATSPSDEGIDQARLDYRQRKAISALCDKFKAFAVDSSDLSMDYDSLTKFLQDAMDVFIDEVENEYL